MNSLLSLQGYINGKVKSGFPTEETDSNENHMSSSYWFGEKMEDPWMPSLSKTQRIMGFFLLLSLGLFCFVMAGILLPVLILKLRKFVLLYTMGGFFTMGSFSLLWGPWNHLKHITSLDRIPFTFAYLGSMSATLYAAISLRSTPLTIIFASLQIASLLWYITSYIPGGTTGMKFFTKMCASMCTKTVTKTLPI